ncbi:MAG: hypothetical protein KDB96_11395 [Flavobacteriales bacterium]|nr:hypothetical protein [Flavobacteriales bacterium]MCB0781978.1 hypothetical protein [Flavobacteriales bacterium]MCB0783272.1 hypothetical protein [Flavobacteriales bacterium]MCB0809873.1 hypothetical protein [Flavobacteriales bacterium]MCB0814794.1 hypothetical protein [Flavobacteriales bacterium]
MYDALYQEQLEVFQSRFAATYPDPGETRFTDFYPSLGVPDGMDVDFLIYGQAVGGWHEDMDLAIPVPSNRTEISRTFSNDRYGEDSPIDWVNARWSKRVLHGIQDTKQRAYYTLKDSGYWASRSFFWQLTIKVLQSYYGTANEDDWGWSKQLVWSNLYKIARQKENPMEDVRVLQRQYAVELVRRELDELQPKFCLIITSDPWWAPFRRGLGTLESSEDLDGQVVQSIERYSGTKVIVVHRPFVGNSKRYSEVIVSHLR